MDDLKQEFANDIDVVSSAGSVVNTEKNVSENVDIDTIKKIEPEQ